MLKLCVCVRLRVFVCVSCWDVQHQLECVCSRRKQRRRRGREDKEGEMLSHEAALKNAPKKDSNYFRVPKVIE